MLLGTTRMHRRRLLRSRIPQILIFVVVLISILDAIRIHSDIVRVELDKKRLRDADHRRNKERIYIASMHFNDEVLLREHWNDALLDLVEALGRENVWVNIYESGSWDNTKMALWELDNILWERKIPRRITLGEETHLEEVKKGEPGQEGYIRTPRGMWEPRRIPFLAKLRNRSIQDLTDLHKQGFEFDKVLFLNDVVFHTEDILNLLNTNSGDYAAACSLDFSTPPIFYDTFALRDAEGHAHTSLTWPYFQSSISRDALIRHTDAVPVKSCWNGVVAMPAAPFVSSSNIKFRGISDSLAAHHLEGSECCLIHADNPLSQGSGVYLNPRVRVGYSTDAYKAVNPEDGSWVGVWQIFFGMWKNRLARWTNFSPAEWIVHRRVGKWSREQMGGKEPGWFCLINEMQVLIEEGWAHL